MTETPQPHDINVIDLTGEQVRVEVDTPQATAEGTPELAPIETTHSYHKRAEKAEAALAAAGLGEARKPGLALTLPRTERIDNSSERRPVTSVVKSWLGRIGMKLFDAASLAGSTRPEHLPLVDALAKSNQDRQFKRDMR